MPLFPLVGSQWDEALHPVMRMLASFLQYVEGSLHPDNEIEERGGWFVLIPLYEGAARCRLLRLLPTAHFRAKDRLLNVWVTV